MTAALFFAAELETYQPSVPDINAVVGWGTVPWGALSISVSLDAGTDVLRVSDTGYRTMPGDPGGVQVYRPYLQSAFAIDASINLDLTASSVGAAWGDLEISNADGSFDMIAAARNCDGRRITILTGRKTYDPARDYYADPGAADLTALFQGVGTPWFLGDAVLTVPLRDATYWIERPVQTDLYGGAGRLDGNSDLAGRAKPMARGGTAADPIRNVTPVLIDPAQLIYQYSDAPGQAVAVYIGGNTGTVSAGDVADLYSGTVPAGQFRTCNARGLFQLGSSPSNAVTCDVAGAFPSGATASSPLDLVRLILTEDMLLPPELIDTAAFTAAAAATPWVAGLYLDGSETPDGVTAVEMLLQAAGAQLAPTLDGRLAPLLLRAPGGAAAAVFSPDNTVSVTPQTLPDTLDPPPWRIRIGYQHNWTVQGSSDLVGAVTAARRLFLSQADRIVAWSATGAAALAYRRPNDPAAIATGLLRQADAQVLVNALGALWGVRRRLYAVEVPIDVGIGRWLGETVRLIWPVQDLALGPVGLVAGVSIQSTSAATITLKVLV